MTSKKLWAGPAMYNSVCYHLADYFIRVIVQIYKCTTKIKKLPVQSKNILANIIQKYTLKQRKFVEGEAWS